MAYNKIEFEDFSIKAIKEIEKRAIKGLTEAAGELEAQVKRNTAVDTGQLKGSWDYVIDKVKLEALIGSPLENAIWEELGTGEYALNGDGRKGGWVYQDAEGNWHYTNGKRPRRAMYRAYVSKKNTLIKIIRKAFSK